ncbi:DMT family transporter [Salisediminibacterium beveridgei]|uniref:Permease of the drug/metabolite transporter (DMT) superfamily n=1 Tax=Salisediminibacterium beveridgei TaxID=632773 RepID=A0A1D7QXP7_9BACI|nr:DMT family transporter [Salisediminibacterium beveridgei]AOM83780.1 Permease of the drug/metabolite transporter (DMT) superfamily [Salisediminibacterium beveridgei]
MAAIRPVQNEEAIPKTGLLLTISIIAISFAAIFVKWSEAPATVISMYRMFLASLLLVPFVWWKRKDLFRLTGRDVLILCGSGIFLALHFALWFGSLKLTTVASSTIILALQPIVALAGGYYFYKERTDLRTVVTISIAFIGIVIIGIGDIGISPAHLLGDVLSFLSVIAIVGYLLIGQTTVKKISHWIYSFCVFFIAGVLLLLYNLVMQVEITGYGTTEWQLFWLLAIFPTLAHVIYNLLLKYVNTTTISMSILGEPVGASILAVFLLGEMITLQQFTGGLFVLGSVYVFLRNR